MKNYIKPEFEVLLLNLQDVITDSTFIETVDDLDGFVFIDGKDLGW